MYLNNFARNLHFIQKDHGDMFKKNIDSAVDLFRGAAQDLKNFIIMSVQYFLAYFSTFSEPKSV